MNIAIVGNDSRFCLLLEELLESQSHRVILVPDSAKAFTRIASEPTHLVVLGAALSHEACRELVRELRGHAATQRLPILSVDPQAGPKEVVDLLDCGADDFLTKPFNGRVFLARVRALLRRRIWGGAVAEEDATVLRGGPIEVRLVERRAFVSGAPAELTRLEFDLISFILRHKDRVMKRQEILDGVWNYPQGVETRTLDKHVETLRRKLGGAASCIETVHGIGLRFSEAGHTASPKMRR